MIMASTIIIAREDLSIPGSEQDKQNLPEESANTERRFFELLRDNRPDVVVLDCAVTAGRGIEAIRKIRERNGVPILVVCSPDDPLAADYRIAGAADCLHIPLDLAQLNYSIQRIIRLTRSTAPTRQRMPEGFLFADITYRPDQNALRGPTGVNLKLTTSENELLYHLLTHSWTVCSRADIAAIVYRDCPPASDRAIDVLVNRLRKKLVSMCGTRGEDLIKTEFRRGYVLTVDVEGIGLQDVSQGAALSAV